MSRISIQIKKITPECSLLITSQTVCILEYILLKFSHEKKWWYASYRNPNVQPTQLFFLSKKLLIILILQHQIFFFTFIHTKWQNFMNQWMWKFFSIIFFFILKKIFLRSYIQIRYKNVTWKIFFLISQLHKTNVQSWTKKTRHSLLFRHISS